MSLLRVTLGDRGVASVPGRFDPGTNQPLEVLFRYSALVMLSPAKSPGELLALQSPADSAITVGLGDAKRVPSSSR